MFLLEFLLIALKDKPLQLINGKALSLFVAESLIETQVFDRVIVATDSKKVLSLFEGHRAQAFMTDPHHESGTDRIYEVIEKLGVKKGVVFNIQGDEPFIYKEDLLALKSLMDQGAKMASMYEPLCYEEVEDLNKVKVLINKKNEAIYFSRFGLPFSRNKLSNKQQALKTLSEGFSGKKIGKHIGIYAYELSFLKDFCKHGESYFESFEKLEQLRALEMGVPIKMIQTTNTYLGVDTQADLVKANELIKKRELENEK